jgi:hypothetical protein
MSFVNSTHPPQYTIYKGQRNILLILFFFFLFLFYILLIQVWLKMK